MEHWRPEMNTFHMYHGECSITLHDVAHLTGLSVTGDALYVDYDLDGLISYGRRAFWMEQPIPRIEMLEAEVMVLLGLTRRREVGMRATMRQYLGRWDARDEHVVETGPVRDAEH
ncbi:hypothetical protein LINGRAHAP2_LOCUS30556 [Linum grandiflorum]